MLLSIVVPAKNEQATLLELFNRLHEVVLSEEHKLQVVFVDDGSTDNTWQEMTSLANKYSGIVTALRLRRNFGKATALAVGFEQCRGEVVFTIDADLQDDPTEIPRFLEKMSEGYDVVSGWKVNRQDPVSKTLPSKLYNYISKRVTGLELHDLNCGFKAYRREVLEKISLYGELHRYIPVFAHDLGYNVGEIPVKHFPRSHGQSKYGLERYARGLIDLITVHSTTHYLQKPGHLFGGIGLIAGLSGAFILLYLAIQWIFGPDPIGTRPLFFVGIMLVILSVQMISLGVMAELINKNSESRTAEMIIAERTGANCSIVPHESIVKKYSNLEDR